jgi:hypothetical protein
VDFIIPRTPAISTIFFAVVHFQARKWPRQVRLVVTPLNNPGGPEGDTVTVDEQLLNTEYSEKPLPMSIHAQTSYRHGVNC